MDTTYKQWNIQGYQSPEPSAIEARTENEDGLSAVAGALICLGVIIGVGAIIMLIVLMRLVNTCVMECSHILVVQCNTNSEVILQQCMYACGGSRPSHKEGGGGGVIHTPRKVGRKGGLKKKNFRPFGPQFGPKIRGGLDPPLS